MKKMKQKLLIPCLLLMVMASCKFAPDAVNVPNWDMDLLGPLVNTSANGNKIVQMKTLKGAASITFSKIDTATGTFPIPALGPIDTLPAFHFQLFNAFKALTLETGMLYFTLDNNMPITLKTGAWITLTDSISGVVLMHVQLNADVPANGGHYQYTTGVDLSGKTIENDLLLTVTNLSTAASNGAVHITGNESFTVSAFLENASLSGCTILPDTLELRDTSEFSLQGYKVKTQMLGEDTITVFITNGLPFNMNLQFYFLRADHTIIDSLFDGGTFIPQRTSSTQPSLASLVFTFTDIKLKHLVDSRFIYSNLRVKNGAQGITLSKNDAIKLLLVGHLQVKLN